MPDALEEPLRVAVIARNCEQIAKELEDFALILMSEGGEALGIDHTCGSHEVTCEERIAGSGTWGVPAEMDRAHSGPDR
jgi:hypothetical protein